MGLSPGAKRKPPALRPDCPLALQLGQYLTDVIVHACDLIVIARQVTPDLRHIGQIRRDDDILGLMGSRDGVFVP